MTLSRTQLLSLMDEHGIRPRRALGQNFVADENTVRRIARLAEVGTGTNVVEIGAGLGSLTTALADTGAAVTAVEADSRLIPVLRSEVAPLGVRVIEGDAMKLDWPDLLAGKDQWVLVANLPYNLATPLVITLLEAAPVIRRMLVMVQREVAERLAASPGHPAYGAVSVKVDYWATSQIVAKVPPTVFVPRPRVESALVSIVRRQSPAVDPQRVPYEELATLVRAGFAHRRQMLRRVLAGLVDDRVFTMAGVSPESRAEDLGVELWGKLAECRRSINSGP